MARILKILQNLTKSFMGYLILILDLSIIYHSGLYGLTLENLTLHIHSISSCLLALLGIIISLCSAFFHKVLMR